MSVGGVGGGANNFAMAMMNLMMKNMEAQSDMTMQLLEVNVENGIAAQKMDIAQQIIDVYA